MQLGDAGEDGDDAGGRVGLNADFAGRGRFSVRADGGRGEESGEVGVGDAIIDGAPDEEVGQGWGVWSWRGFSFVG